jgi:hypothetical protein
MFKIKFYILLGLVMEVIIMQGPIPAPGDRIDIGGKLYLVENRIWHYREPDPESITLNVYGIWV